MSFGIGPATREDHPLREWKSEDPHSREIGPHSRHRTLREEGPGPLAGKGKSKGNFKGKKQMFEKSTPDAPLMLYKARPHNRPEAFTHAGSRCAARPPHLYIA